MEMSRRTMCLGHVAAGWTSTNPELWALELYNTETPNTEAPLQAVWLVLALMTLSLTCGHGI